MNQMLVSVRLVQAKGLDAEQRFDAEALAYKTVAWSGEDWERAAELLVIAKQRKETLQ